MISFTFQSVLKIPIILFKKKKKVSSTLHQKLVVENNYLCFIFGIHIYVRYRNACSLTV